MAIFHLGFPAMKHQSMQFTWLVSMNFAMTRGLTEKKLKKWHH